MATIDCLSCLKYIDSPELEHKTCTDHRACTGPTSWLPDNCVHCKQIISFIQSGEGAHENILNDLCNMLRETQKTRRNKWTWSYTAIFMDSPPHNSSLVPSTSSSEFSPSIRQQDSNLPTTVRQEMMTEQVVNASIPDQCATTHGHQDQENDVNIIYTSKEDGVSKSLRNKRKRSLSPQRSSSSSNNSYSKSLKNSTYMENLTLFFDEDEIYYYWKPSLKREGNKVFIANSWKLFIDHPTKNAFKLVTNVSDRTLFSYSAFEDVAARAGTSAVQFVERFGTKSKSIKWSAPNNSNMSYLFEDLNKNTVKYLFAKAKKCSSPLKKLFSNFDSQVTIDFETSWTLNPDGTYQDWAKNDNVSIQHFIMYGCLSYSIYIPSRYFDEEKCLRLRIVDCLSNLALLEGFGAERATPYFKIDMAVARNSLSILKELVILWMKAKLNIRNILLQASDHPIAVDLLYSDIWSHHIFPLSAIEKAIEADSSKRGLAYHFNLSSTLNFHFKKHPVSFDLFLLDPKNFKKTFRSNVSSFYSPQSSSSEP